MFRSGERAGEEEGGLEVLSGVRSQKVLNGESNNKSQGWTQLRSHLLLEASRPMPHLAPTMEGTTLSRICPCLVHCCQGPRGVA